jgi:DNA transformation protein
MPRMTASDSEDRRRFATRVLMRLQEVAPVTSRAMFGGHGFYLDGAMFALGAYGTLYFKVDDHNRADYLTAGCGPFVYHGRGVPIEMSYYELPGEVWDDLEALDAWLHAAHAAAVRAKAGRR